LLANQTGVVIFHQPRHLLKASSSSSHCFFAKTIVTISKIIPKIVAPIPAPFPAAQLTIPPIKTIKVIGANMQAAHPDHPQPKISESSRQVQQSTQQHSQQSQQQQS
jgi:hypothetical protein